MAIKVEALTFCRHLIVSSMFSLEQLRSLAVCLVSARALVSSRSTDKRIDPLSAMTRLNNPRLLGSILCSVTEAPPADSPKIVTLPGFPPKSRMLSLTHLKASCWSKSP